jgi:hypothetical protein
MLKRRSDLKQKANAHFGSGGGAKEFADKHRLPRTTVLGWMKKWSNGEREPDVGRPLKLEPFKSVEILEDLFERRDLLNRQHVGRIIRNRSTHEMNRLGITRYLRRWHISPEGDEFQRIARTMKEHPMRSIEGSLAANVWVDVHQWKVPHELKDQFRETPEKILCRVITRRGLEWFTFVGDTTNDSIAHVADMLSSKKSSWRVYSDSPQLILALRDMKVECMGVSPLGGTSK